MRPLKAQEGGMKVKDGSGEGFGFYQDVPGVLDAARQRGIKLGAASRTHAPGLGREMLKLLKVPRHASASASASTPVVDPSAAAKTAASDRALDLFDYLEIYPGSKTTHFERIHEKSRVEYEEMLFFDDESRNRNVEVLGVVMWLVRDGVSREEIDRGVESWRRMNKKVRNSNGVV